VHLGVCNWLIRGTGNKTKKELAEEGLNAASVDWAVERYYRYLAEQDVASALRLFAKAQIK
jgi:hypothetical protein